MDKVGVEVADGTRRMAVVGGIFREEMIIFGDCLSLPSREQVERSEFA